MRLAAVRAEPVWLDRARALAEVIEEQFDDGDGGYFDTAADAERLYTRPAGSDGQRDPVRAQRGDPRAGAARPS